MMDEILDIIKRKKMLNSLVPSTKGIKNTIQLWFDR